MLTTLKTTALAASLALASAVPAAATVLNFEFFSDDDKTAKLWGVEIDFGDFGFNMDLTTGVTEGITLTHPVAPLDTGMAAYTYQSGDFPLLTLRVEGKTEEEPERDYFYLFSAQCVPECEDGSAPFYVAFGVDGAAANENVALLFSSFFPSQARNSTTITDITPPPAAAVIPLPAAGWLLLGGLGALGALRRRRA